MPHVSLFHEVPWSGCYSISTVRRFKSWICRSSDSRVTFSWCAGFSKVPQEYLAHWLSIARVLLSHLVAFENPSWWAHFLLRNRFIFTVKRDSLPSPTSAKSCIFFQWHGLIFKYLRAFWIWNNSSFLLTTSLHATHSLLPPPSPLPILIALYVKYHSHVTLIAADLQLLSGWDVWPQAVLHSARHVRLEKKKPKCHILSNHCCNLHMNVPCPHYRVFPTHKNLWEVEACVMLPRGIHGYKGPSYHSPWAWGSLVCTCCGAVLQHHQPGARQALPSRPHSLYWLMIDTLQPLSPPSIHLQCEAPDPLDTLSFSRSDISKEQYSTALLYTQHLDLSIEKVFCFVF